MSFRSIRQANRNGPRPPTPEPSVPAHTPYGNAFSPTREPDAQPFATTLPPWLQAADLSELDVTGPPSVGGGTFEGGSAGGSWPEQTSSEHYLDYHQEWEMPEAGRDPLEQTPGVEVSYDNPSLDVEINEHRPGWDVRADSGHVRHDYPGDFYTQTNLPKVESVAKVDDETIGFSHSVCGPGVEAGYDTTDRKPDGHRISYSQAPCRSTGGILIENNDHDETQNVTVNIPNTPFTVESEDPFAPVQWFLETLDVDEIDRLNYDFDNEHTATAEVASKIPGVGDDLAHWFDDRYVPPEERGTVLSNVVDLATQVAASTTTPPEPTLPPVEQEAYTPDITQEMAAIDTAIEENAPATETVGSGDSLSAIAARMSAESGQNITWQQVYEANKNTIGDNPNAISAGMNLQVPRVPDARPATASTGQKPSYETTGDENGDGVYEYAPGYVVETPKTEKTEKKPSSYTPPTNRFSGPS